MKLSGAVHPRRRTFLGGQAQVALSKGVHATRIGDDVIFLDVGRDRYAIYPDADHDIELTTDTYAVKSANTARLQELLVEQLIDLDAPFRRLTRKVVRSPERSFGSEARREAGACDRLTFAFVMSRAPLHDVAAGLGSMLRFADRRSANLSRDPVLAGRRAAVFADLLVWSPFQGDCLFRSHLLLRFLRAGGVDADWVFAVRTWPFAAHCWLQLEDLVLNDTAENLRAFSPILVV